MPPINFSMESYRSSKTGMCDNIYCICGKIAALSRFRASDNYIKSKYSSSSFANDILISSDLDKEML